MSGKQEDSTRSLEARIRDLEARVAQMQRAIDGQDSEPVPPEPEWDGAVVYFRVRWSGATRAVHYAAIRRDSMWWLTGAVNPYAWGALIENLRSADYLSHAGLYTYGSRIMDGHGEPGRAR